MSLERKTVGEMYGGFDVQLPRFVYFRTRKLGTCGDVKSYEITMRKKDFLISWRGSSGLEGMVGWVFIPNLDLVTTRHQRVRLETTRTLETKMKIPKGNLSKSYSWLDHNFIITTSS